MKAMKMRIGGLFQRGRTTHLSLLRQTSLSRIQDCHCPSLKALHNWPCRDYSFVGAREKEQAAYGFAERCDRIIYSHEAGLAKPDPHFSTSASQHFSFLADKLTAIHPPGVSMSITYLGYSQAKPDEIDALRDFLLTVVLPAVQNSEGNESCQMWQSQDDPTQFVVMEVWASVEAHRASIKNITQAEINAYMKLVAAAPRGGYYDLLRK
jgi:quinol monooxygenase YgiN